MSNTKIHSNSNNTTINENNNNDNNLKLKTTNTTSINVSTPQVLNEDSSELLETPQISRFQHENVFAASFREESIKPQISIFARETSTFDGTSVETQNGNNNEDLSDSLANLSNSKSTAIKTSSPPLSSTSPPPTTTTASTSPLTITTPTLTNGFSNQNGINDVLVKPSAPKKTLLQRTISQNDADAKQQQLVESLKAAANLSNTTAPTPVIIDTTLHQLIDNNNNNTIQIPNGIMLHTPPLTLKNRITSDKLNNILINTDSKQNQQAPLTINLNSARAIMQPGKPAQQLQQVLAPLIKSAANTTNLNGLPLKITTAAVAPSTTMMSTIPIVGVASTVLSQQSNNSYLNSNNQKRATDTLNINNSNKILKSSSPPVLTSSISQSNLNLLASSITQNDDILIDTKQLIHHNISTDSDNSMLSKTSIDDNNNDIGKIDDKKSLNERKKEKRRASLMNNDARRQQIRNSNREAARRCRERRRVYIETLENNIRTLETKQKALMNENSALKKEINNYQRVLLQHKDCSISTASLAAAVAASAGQQPIFAQLAAAQPQQQSQQQQLHQQHHHQQQQQQQQDGINKSAAFAPVYAIAIEMPGTTNALANVLTYNSNNNTISATAINGNPASSDFVLNNANNNTQRNTFE